MFETFLKSFVAGHRSQLVKAFREKQDGDGHVATDEWADTIAELLDLPETSLTWLDLQPDVAPAVDDDGEKIDWTVFLNKYTTVPTTSSLQKDQLAALSEHKERFLDIFQLLDTDGSGTIDKEEFTSGIKLLNQQMPEGAGKMEDAAELFDVFDVEKKGEISMADFSNAIQNSTALQGVTEALNDDKIESLKENQDMIAGAFKYLDTNGSGGIDREQFQKGFDAVNERMPERNKFKDPQEWFDMLDVDENGVIDFTEFKQVFCAL